MKKFNKIGKVNTLYRTIATVLVFAIALLAFPEMKEVQAADYPSEVTVDIEESGQIENITIRATNDGHAKLAITFPEGTEYTALGSPDSSITITPTATSLTIEWSNVTAGTDYNFSQTFDYSGYELASTVNVRLLGAKEPFGDISLRYGSNIEYASFDGYSTTYYKDFVNFSGRLNSDNSTYLMNDSYGDYSTYRPLMPGSYEVKANLGETDTQEGGNVSKTFTISKYTPTLSIPDVNPGEVPHPTYKIASNDGTTFTYNGSADSDSPAQYVTVMYKGENDSDFTAAVPTAAGTYTAKLSYIEGYERYNKDISTSFKITLKEGKGTVTVKDTVYGESSVKPEAKSDTNDADKAEFFYKVKNTDDSTYTKDRPTKPGNYVCKAVFPKTGDYDKCEATCIFTIDRGKGIGSLTASDVYVGMEPKTTPTSATNGTTAVKYYYKEKSEDASKYTDKLPTKPGEYTVKAVFPMTDYYYETSAEASFKTSYMPAPTFGLTGKQGKNDFYTDTVSVKAPAGYEVSLSYGKDYKDSINILDGVKYVYFKDKATGALSDKAAVPAYKMDSLLPVVKGVKNNDTIFKDEYELEITDDYLEMVKVNDQTVPVKDGKATYKLTSDSGEMLYKIEATDQAGHTVTYTITVASPWVKDGFVPAGQIVKLKPGKAYSLKGGKKYKIKGDDTVYNGGTQFYVDEERELELEEYNEN